jgi:SAM-dependent methyltransferase
LPVSGAGRLVDLACGTGQVALSLAHHFAEVVVDQEEEMVAYGRAKAEAAGVYVRRVGCLGRDAEAGKTTRCCITFCRTGPHCRVPAAGTRLWADAEALDLELDTPRALPTADVG